MNHCPISRRAFFRLSALAAAAAAATACQPAPQLTLLEDEDGPQATPTSVRLGSASSQKTVVPTPTFTRQLNEAPMLAEMVQRGELPEVADRLPINPCVAPALASVGQYGGALRRGFKGVSDRWGPTKLVDHGLVWYEKDLSLRAHLAESWEVNDDGTLWTIRLRVGMKWSDGQPFTSRDFVWWYENVLQNKEATPSIPTAFTTGTPPVLAEMKAVDDFTVTFQFAHPNPLFIYRMARTHPFAPAHALARYHQDQAEDPAALQADMQARGFDDWASYFEDRGAWYLNMDRPTLGPWVARNPLSDEVFLMARNPYYPVIDVGGSQLPYIDHVQHRMFNDVTVFDMWIVGGEIDFQARHVQLNNYTLYKESEDRGDYQLVTGIGGTHIGMIPNHTCKDANLRAFFQEVKVRQALNLAINRQEINQIIYDGLAVPSQYAPVRLSPQYYPKATQAFISYDPKKANSLLDEAGYQERDERGFRKWKDGSGTISIIIDHTTAGSVSEDTLLLLTQYYGEVGLKVTYRVIERALYEELAKTNDITVSSWGGDRAILPIVAEAPIWRGIQEDRPWAQAWNLWKSVGPDEPNAEEPPSGHWIRTIWGVWDELAKEPDPERQTALFRQILDTWAEHTPTVGILSELPALAIVKQGLRNFATGFPMDDTLGDESVYNPETLYWDEPGEHQILI